MLSKKWNQIFICSCTGYCNPYHKSQQNNWCYLLSCWNCEEIKYAAQANWYRSSRSCRCFYVTRHAIWFTRGDCQVPRASIWFLLFGCGLSLVLFFLCRLNSSTKTYLKLYTTMLWRLLLNLLQKKALTRPIMGVLSARFVFEVHSQEANDSVHISFWCQKSLRLGWYESEWDPWYKVEMLGIFACEAIYGCAFEWMIWWNESIIFCFGDEQNPAERFSPLWGIGWFFSLKNAYRRLHPSWSYIRRILN